MDISGKDFIQISLMMKENSELIGFLKPYSREVQELMLELRGLISQWVPEANQLIWDGYNAVAVAFSRSFKLADAFCHIAVYSEHVNLGFNRGVELQDDANLLEGSGKLIRHIKVRSLQDLPLNVIEQMVLQAAGIAESLNPSLKHKTTKGESRVMSVSKNKIRPKGN